MTKPTSGIRQVISLLGVLVLTGLNIRKFTWEIHDPFSVVISIRKIAPFYKEGAAILSQDSVVYRYPPDSFQQFMISNGRGVIVGVSSAASSQYKRELVRNTWAFNRSNVFFLVAGNWSDVENEFAEKRDLFWIDKDESYHEVNFKVQTFIAAVERHVPHFHHLLKTNDDSYVRLAAVERLSATDQNADYWGICIKGNVERSEGHERLVSKEEDGKDMYPSNAQNTEYLLSQRQVKCLAKVKKVTNDFNVEDARSCRAACVEFGSRLHDASKGPPSEFSLISRQVKTEAMTELHNLSCHRPEADVISCASGCWTSLIDAIFPKGEEAERLCDSKVLAELQTDPRWERYRFSDYIKGRHVPHKNRRQEKNWAAFDPSYPGSLFDEYSRQSTLDGVSRRGNMNVLHKVVQRRARKAAESPPPNSLVVHLRLGDVIDAANETVPELLRTQHYFYHDNNTGEEYKKAWNAYVRPLARFSKLPFENDVIIMGATHYGQSDLRGNVTKSCLYMRAIQKYFEMRGAKVTLRLGRPPDDDLVYGSQSKWYAQAGGGYSKIIGKLVMRSGGQVFE